MSGNDLFEQLTTQQGGSDYYFNYGSASGYVLGVVDSTGGKRLCIPRGVIVKQLVDATRAYLTTNPQLRHLPADLLVSNALSNMFPCNAK